MAFRDLLELVGEFLLSGFPDPQLELVFVMIIVPMTFNALVFWITDCFLKFTKTETEDEKYTQNFEIQSPLIVN